jgi:hypothetical protein
MPGRAITEHRPRTWQSSSRDEEDKPGGRWDWQTSLRQKEPPPARIQTVGYMRVPGVGNDCGHLNLRRYSFGLRRHMGTHGFQL